MALNRYGDLPDPRAPNPYGFPDNPTTNPTGYAATTPGGQNIAQLTAAAWRYATQHSSDPAQQINLALEYKKAHDPSFQLPAGFKDENGKISVDTGGGWGDPNNI